MASWLASAVEQGDAQITFDVARDEVLIVREFLLDIARDEYETFLEYLFAGGIVQRIFNGLSRFPSAPPGCGSNPICPSRDEFGDECVRHLQDAGQLLNHLLEELLPRGSGGAEGQGFQRVIHPFPLGRFPFQFLDARTEAGQLVFWGEGDAGI
ncbi:MAG: hypothetical protein IT389_13245 [Nitrospira sp.]|nr:hypothetical protein [Nitrospira sp.]